MKDRRTARNVALKALYARELSGESAEHILETVVSKYISDPKNKDVKDFAESLFLRTIKNQEELDEILQDHSRNWRIERLAVVDKLILRFALAEFLFFEEIPTKVTINEAIEISKEYSTKKSSSFINGILDSALESLNKEDRITKTGRGLIET